LRRHRGSFREHLVVISGFTEAFYAPHFSLLFGLADGHVGVLAANSNPINHLEELAAHKGSGQRHRLTPGRPSLGG